MFWRVKKAHRKTGAKRIWLTNTRVEIARSFERKLKDWPSFVNLLFQNPPASENPTWEVTMREDEEEGRFVYTHQR